MPTSPTIKEVLDLPYGQAFQILHQITDSKLLKSIIEAASDAAITAYDTDDMDEFGRLAGIEAAAIDVLSIRTERSMGRL